MDRAPLTDGVIDTTPGGLTILIAALVKDVTDPMSVVIGKLEGLSVVSYGSQPCPSRTRRVPHDQRTQQT